jgi:hypothetical protein
MIHRVMGPMFLGTIDPETGEMALETSLVEGRGDTTRPIARLTGVKPWDTMVVENLRNGIRRCGFVLPEGTVRANTESDIGDPIVISFYRGPQLVAGSEACELHPAVEPFIVVDSWSEEIEFLGNTYPAGSPLVALTEGLGMRRVHPDLRRMGGLAQLVLDPSDPAVLAPNMLVDPLHYPGTNQSTATHALIITTMGDSAVPVSGGQTVGRAAGLIDYLRVDGRYGVPVNQMLIDT